MGAIGLLIGVGAMATRKGTGMCGPLIMASAGIGNIFRDWRPWSQVGPTASA